MNIIFQKLLAVTVLVLFVVSLGSAFAVHAQELEHEVPVASGGSTSGQPAGGGSNAGGPATTGGSSGGSNVFYLQNPLSSQFNSVGGLVQGFLEIFSYLVILFAVLMLIWTGLQFILAQGEPKRLSELKSQLLWIVIGIAIVIGARIIVTVVINTLSAASGPSNSGVIQQARNAIQTQP